MKFLVVLVCSGLALLATTKAGVVPPKAGLSHKDKLALDLPVKQHLTDKAGDKNKSVKVGFSTTSTTSTTTTTVTPSRPQRPKYIDAAVFRHQFTTPVTSSETSSLSVAFDDIKTPESVGHVASELGLVTDRKTESFRRGFRPASASVVIRPSGSSSTTTTTPSTTVSTTTTTASSPEEVESHDYEAHFRLMDDLSPFGGELGILGGDRRGAGYIGSFRPLGF